MTALPEREGISTVLPAYNEEENLPDVVKGVRAALEKVTSDLEIIIVDDGSRDGTRSVAEALASEDPRIRVVRHERNRGYGAALRSGFAAATKEYCFYTDTDLQFDLTEFQRLLPLLPGADVVTGFRERRRDPFHRRLHAALYRRMIAAIFGLRVRDVNCAFKIYRTALLKSLDLRSDSIFISGEALIKAAQKGCIIREVAVTHLPRTRGIQTGNSPATLLRAFLEFVRLAPGIRLGGGARRRADRGEGP